MRTVSSRTLAVLLLPLSLAACSPAIQVTRLPALDAVTSPIARVGVLPVHQVADAAVPAARPDAAPPQQPREMLENALRTGLAARKITVISSSDLAAATGNTVAALDSLDPAAACEQARAHDAADAVVSAEVLRFRERKGSDLGVDQPASVSFRVTLWHVADHAALWSAEFDETQEPLSSNLFNLGRYPGNGARWLTAEELLRWGAAEAAARLPTSR